MAISNKILSPLNGTMSKKQTSNAPYVDDMFDPLFNAEVTNYYKQKYGSLAIPAAYASMWENALAGKKGILGPGMGVLSTFGRSMDKADDLILGGLTEGVNYIGKNVLGGSNDPATNPLTNIMVNDYDYQGVKLMAAMGNSMAKLQGGVKLDETNFSNPGDRIAGLTLDLATDPGIAGGFLARMNKGSTLGNIGQIMSNYDDTMADVAGNLAVPGAKFVLTKNLSKIKNLVGGAQHRNLMDMAIGNEPTFKPDYTDQLNTMAKDMATKSFPTISPYDPITSDIYKTLNDIEDISFKVQGIKQPTAVLDALNKDATVSDEVANDLAIKRTTFGRAANQENSDFLAKHGTKEQATTIDNLEDLDEDTVEMLRGMSPQEANEYLDSLSWQDKLEDLYIKNQDSFDEANFSKVFKDNPTTKLATNDSPIYYSTSTKALRQGTAEQVSNEVNRSLLGVIAKNKDTFSKTLTLEDKALTSSNLPGIISKAMKADAYKYTTSNIFNDAMYSNLQKMTQTFNMLGKKKIPGTSFDKYINGVQGFVDGIIQQRDNLINTKLGSDLVDWAEGIQTKLLNNISVTTKEGLEAIDPAIVENNLVAPNWLNYADLKDFTTTLTDGSKVMSIDDFRKMQSELKYGELNLKPTGLLYVDAKSAKDFALTPDTFINKSQFDKIKYKFQPKIKSDYVNVNNSIVEALTSSTPKITVNVTTQLNKVNKTIEAMDKLPPKTYINVLTSNKALSDLKQEDMFNNVFENYKNNWQLPSDISNDALEQHIKTYGDKQTQTLFAMLNSQQVTKIATKRGDVARGVFKYSPVEDAVTKVDNIVKSKKYTPDDVKKYLIYNSYLDDQIIKGDDMLSYLTGSGGRVTGVIRNKNKDLLNALEKTLTDNISAINAGSKNGDILTLIKKSGKDTTTLGYMFNTKNINIKKNIEQLSGLFKSKPILKDMVFVKGNPRAKEALISTYGDKFKDLDDAFDSIRTASGDLSKRLGFPEVQPNYIKYAMAETPEAKTYFSNFARDIDADDNALTNITNAVKNTLATKGALGTNKLNRSYLGTFDMYGDAFSSDLKFIQNSTFTKGFLDNTDAQSFAGLFLNDNFKIQNSFKNAEHLKKALYIGAPDSGNLTNLSLISPRYNEEGKLISFKRYDKFSDLAIKQAYDDPNCILAETQNIAFLDRMLKKDARLSSKVYQFFNKYFTVPFKFGTLANPGFLVGNIEDAYFKQAVALSEKHGTTLSDELANVAGSIRDVTILNNKFSEVFDKYRQYLQNLDPAEKKLYSTTSGMVEVLDPDVVMGNPKYFKDWQRYLDYGNLDSNEQSLAKFFTYLNGYQNMSMFKNNNLDLEDVIEKMQDNPYDQPSNFLERVLYGKGKYSKGNFNSWGLMLNNPVGNSVLKCSNQIETLMRSSTILNDLKHRGWTTEKISKLLNIPVDEEVALRQTLRRDMADAINTMHSANFDYDNVSALMNKISYIVPFPTFYLKNMAFWADIVVKHPQMIDNIISVQEGLWAAKNKDVQTNEFTAEAKGRGAIPFNITGHDKVLTGIAKQSPYSSMFGAFNSINNFKPDIAYRMNPVLRPITRHLQDPEDVQYRPYSTNIYEKNIKQGDPQFSELAYMFHQMNPYDRFVKTYLRTPKKVATNNYQVSDFLPSIFQPDFSKK